MTKLEAKAFCEKVARTHYENFTVGSWLLPAELRQHFFNIYAFCRWSDDLGDELGSPEVSLRALENWREELKACYEGKPVHPVFVALEETIREFQIPSKPFEDLIAAFCMDQRRQRWERFQDLLFYCEHSANPVGHLVLYLFGYRDSSRQSLADQICTGLQLANFWQDVRRDLEKGRVYIPLEDLEKFKVGEEDLRAPRANAPVRTLIEFEVRRTREFFEKGRDLIHSLRGRERFEIELFRQGGLRVLDRIQKQNYDVLEKRPALGRLEKAGIFFKAVPAIRG